MGNKTNKQYTRRKLDLKPHKKQTILLNLSMACSLKFTFVFLGFNSIVWQKSTVCYSENEMLDEKVADEVGALYIRVY